MLAISAWMSATNFASGMGYREDPSGAIQLASPTMVHMNKRRGVAESFDGFTFGKVVVEAGRVLKPDYIGDLREPFVLKVG